MFPFNRRPEPAAPEPGGLPTPKVADVRLDPSLISDVGVVSVPNTWERFRATVAGRRDGRHGLLPDPECGHTQYTARVADEYGSIIDSEQLMLTRALSRIDELVERLTIEAAQRRGDVEDLSGRTLEARALDTRVAPVLAERRQSRELEQRQAAHQGRIEKVRSRIREIERELAGLAMLRAYQIVATAQRIDRARVTRQQIVDVYWRWFARAHPEESAVRAGYPIPSVDRPAVTPLAHAPRH